MANLAEMYAYLMEQYEPGDRIFLFGFSRGAFTVRALAGMIRCIGLLRKSHENLLPEARDVYENMEARHRKVGRLDDEANDELAREFRRCFARPEDVRVAFLGVWDTVKAYGYMLPKGVPHVRNNELIDVVRHAVAIDEKRPPFQVTGWSDRVLRQDPSVHDIDRRIREVWFAGDHSDVGGGHPDSTADSFTKASFDWVLGEAVHEGLRISSSRYKEVTGWERGAEPLSDCLPHDLSRVGKGRLMWIPPRRELDNSHFPSERNFRFLFDTGRRDLVDHTFPDQVWLDSQRLAGATPTVQRYLLIHESVRERYCKGGYAPENLREAFEASRPKLGKKAEQEVEIKIQYIKSLDITRCCTPG